MKKKILVFDAETFYDQDFTLSKINPFMYVHDPRFEVIGFSMKWYGEGKARWYTGSKEELKRELASVDWANTIVCAHNTAFDGLILTQHFGIYPAGWIDTLSMARPQFGVEVGGSLAKLAAHFGIGVKGEEVIHAKGLKRKDFGAQQLARYGLYCSNDVELTEKILDRLSQVVTPLEMRVIDYTIRMTVEPRLLLDLPMLQQNLIDIQTRKKEALQTAADAVGVLPELLVKELGSGPKFAKMLESFGITPALKDSPTAKNPDGTPKKTFAFAKTDPFMVELLEHEDERVQALVSTRMGVKSTIAESRTLRLIEAAKLGAVPFPLKYASAHTNRWGGDFKWNFQNIPKHPDVKAGKREALRDAIMAPEGFTLVAADSSQVEARVNAWLSGQEDLLALFAAGADPYCEFGGVAYGKPITKADVIERFVSKGCLAEGTPVLTEKRGYVPIEQILLTDRVWDGIEWVNHGGVVYQGEKEVVTYQGLTATPDHGVFTEAGGLPIPFGVAASRLEKLVRTGASGQAVRLGEGFVSGNSTPREEHIHVREMYEVWRREVDREVQSDSRKDGRVPVLLSNEIPAQRSAGAPVRRDCCALQEQTTQALPGLRWQRGGVAFQVANGIYPVGEQKSATPRLQGDGNRSGEQRRTLRAGESPLGYENRTGSESPEHCADYVSRQVDSVSGIPLSIQQELHRPDEKTGTNRGANSGKVRTYDIVNAGPRRRFTVNNFLVLNCVLGLGFGMGSKKLKISLKKPMGGISVDLPEERCAELVQIYRMKYTRITAFWQECRTAVECLFAKRGYKFGRDKCLSVEDGYIQLPSGTRLYYPDMRREKGEKGWDYSYIDREGKKRKRIYSTLLVENIVQAVARDILAWQMVQIGKKWPVVGMVHDELIAMCESKYNLECYRDVVRIMQSKPQWAALCPVTCEGASDVRYGDC